MEIRIPKWNDDKFRKTLKSLDKKGAHFTVIPKGIDTIKVDDHEYEVLVYEVDNTTVYAVPGWEFFGIIEHHEPNNIIRTVGGVNFSDIPKKYLTCGPECEHCNKVRDRNDTYLVKNTSTGEFKQVGKSCLKSYTGFTPSACLWAVSVEKYLLALEADEEDIRANFGAYRQYTVFDTDRVKKIAWAEIQAHGYVSTSNAMKVEDTTKFKVQQLYGNEHAPLASDEDIAKFNEWVDEHETRGEYEYNAKTACQLNHCQYRDFGYIASYVYSYFKYLERQKKEIDRMTAAAGSRYLGSVGDKVTFIVKDARILYTMEPYTYGADYTYAWRLVDEVGNTVIWKTANSGIAEGDVIKGTIKSTNEYRGEKQTTITRGKVIGRADDEIGDDNPDDEIGEALEIFFGDLDI